METAGILRLIGHLAAAGVFGLFVLASYRWTRNRSTIIGAIFAAGIIARVVLGLTLFWISYLQLPLATSLQAGGGFWQPAADARSYYGLSALAAETGVPIDSAAVPSPFFIRMLALWMLAVGVSPVAGMFFNLCLYAAFVLLLVRCFTPVNEWRHDLPCIVGVAAYSFSPVVLIHGTQPLKDDLFNLLIATACLGVLGLKPIIYDRSASTRPWPVVISALAITAAAFGAAGIRWYYALIVWGVLAFVLGVFALRGRTTRLPRYLAGSAAVLIATWLGFWGGAGPYYRAVGSYIGAGPSQLITVAQLSRVGFLMTGGGTNVAVPLRDSSTEGRAHADELVAEQVASDALKKAAAIQASAIQARQAELQAAGGQTESRAAAPGAAIPPRAEPLDAAAEAAAAAWRVEQDQAARAIPVSISDHFSVTAMGLAIIFVPLSVATALFDVTIPGGRGLLAIAEVDTLFQDAAIIFVLVLLWKRRHAIGDRMPFVVFGLVLSAVTAVLLGYVVTNFGTLWRLRSLVVVPLWVLAAALSRVDQRTARVKQTPGLNYDPKVVDGFGGEWNRFDQRTLSESEALRLFDRYFAIFPWNALPVRAVGFDAGCGSGRWARMVAPRVGTLHCIDASELALRVAATNLAGHGNCQFHLATVDSMPLADNTMDFGYSLGVLHHIPDTRSALHACIRKLRPGAPFLLYLYYAFDNRPAWFRMIWRISDILRHILSRCPFSVRSVVCDVFAATIYWPLARFALISERIGLPVDNLPLSAYRSRSFYVMRTDALDRFGTRLEKRFTRAQVHQMMEQAGLSSITFQEASPYWVAVGRKSSSFS